VMPEPEPEPSMPTSADPRAPGRGFTSVFHHPAVVDYHQRLRQEVMRHVVHQQREAVFLERLNRLKAGAVVGAGAGQMPLSTGELGGAATGAAAAEQTVATAAVGDVISPLIGGATAAAGSALPSKSFTPREGDQGVQQQRASAGSAAGAAYAAQREAVGSAVDSLLR
jgi:hypothetical protein